MAAAPTPLDTPLKPLRLPIDLNPIGVNYILSSAPGPRADGRPGGNSLAEAVAVIPLAQRNGLNSRFYRYNHLRGINKVFTCEFNAGGQRYYIQLRDTIHEDHKFGLYRVELYNFPVGGIPVFTKIIMLYIRFSGGEHQNEQGLSSAIIQELIYGSTNKNDHIDCEYTFSVKRVVKFEYETEIRDNMFDQRQRAFVTVVGKLVDYDFENTTPLVERLRALPNADKQNELIKIIRMYFNLNMMYDFRQGDNDGSKIIYVNGKYKLFGEFDSSRVLLLDAEHRENLFAIETDPQFNNTVGYDLTYLLYYLQLNGIIPVDGLYREVISAELQAAIDASIPGAVPSAGNVNVYFRIHPNNLAAAVVNMFQILQRYNPAGAIINLNPGDDARVQLVPAAIAANRAVAERFYTDRFIDGRNATIPLNTILDWNGVGEPPAPPAPPAPPPAPPAPPPAPPAPPAPPPAPPAPPPAPAAEEDDDEADNEEEDIGGAGVLGLGLGGRPVQGYGLERPAQGHGVGGLGLGLGLGLELGLGRRPAYGAGGLGLAAPALGYGAGGLGGRPAYGVGGLGLAAPALGYGVGGLGLGGRPAYGVGGLGLGGRPAYGAGGLGLAAPAARPARPAARPARPAARPAPELAPEPAPVRRPEPEAEDDIELHANIVTRLKVLKSALKADKKLLQNVPAGEISRVIVLRKQTLESNVKRTKDVLLQLIRANRGENDRHIEQIKSIVTDMDALSDANLEAPAAGGAGPAAPEAGAAGAAPEAAGAAPEEAQAAQENQIAGNAALAARLQGEENVEAQGEGGIQQGIPPEAAAGGAALPRRVGRRFRPEIPIDAQPLVQAQAQAQAQVVPVPNGWVQQNIDGQPMLVPMYLNDYVRFLEIYRQRGYAAAFAELQPYVQQNPRVEEHVPRWVNPDLQQPGILGQIGIQQPHEQQQQQQQQHPRFRDRAVEFVLGNLAMLGLYAYGIEHNRPNAGAMIEWRYQQFPALYYYVILPILVLRMMQPFGRYLGRGGSYLTDGRRRTYKRSDKKRATRRCVRNKSSYN